MDKTIRIVITKKEEKALKKLKRLFDVMGIDPVAMSEKIESQEKEIASLKAENESLNKELKASKEENIKFIKDSMTQIALNVQKATQENGANNKPAFKFEGKKINEEY